MKTVYIKRNELFKNIDLFMLNNITQIDEDFIDDNNEIFYSDCEECESLSEEEQENCEECDGEGRQVLEPYQFFICHLDDYQKEQLNAYGVRFGYSEKLECEILPIYDLGTSWDCFSYSKEVDDDYEPEYNETLTRETVY